MLHVYIYVPALENNYEFSLNEHAKTGVVIEEIAYVIGQKEQKSWNGKIENLILCNAENDCILPKEKSLYQCKVLPGSRLILL